MAKDVRWIIPFKNVKETIDYEIRIYDSYTGTKPASWPVTLQAGSEPIKTEEDASDDFFCPVRPSTGTIQVTDFDGTLMEQLIPDNNISRHVRLVRVNKAVTPQVDVAIEWQGFLSCESYSQEYTSVAQNLSINIMSVLEAMDSQELQVANAGIKSVRLAIAECLQAMSDCTFTNIYIPIHDANILAQRINTAILFNENEISKEYGVTYELSSIGCKAALQRICTYMGWVVREQGTSIYFDRIGKKSNYYCYTYASFIANETPTPTQQAKASMNISSLVYRGTGHNKNISQGARSVKVKAYIQTYNINIGLPLCPSNDLTQTKWYGYGSAFIYGEEEYGRQLYMLYSKETVEQVTLHQFEKYVQFNISGGQVNTITYNPSTSRNIKYMIENGSMADIGTNSPNHKLYNESTAASLCSGACLCKSEFEENIVGRQFHEPIDGLYCLFTPLYDNSYIPAQQDYASNLIFDITKITPVVLNNGFVKFNAEMFIISNNLEVQLGGEEIQEDESGYEGKVYTGMPMYLRMKIKIGNQYWDGEKWAEGDGTFILEYINGHPRYNEEKWLKMYNLDEGYYMPIESLNTLSGIAEISLYDISYLTEKLGAYGTRIYPCEAIFHSMYLDFVVYEDVKLNNNEENNYYRLLHTNFKENVVVETNIATYLRNTPSASFVIDPYSDKTFIRNLKYIDNLGEEYEEIPERDLLDRLADYYSKKRRKLELICEHPTTAALPLLQIDARNNAAGQVNAGYDGKLYLPLAESRDWQQDTSTITCFETPDGDE